MGYSLQSHTDQSMKILFDHSYRQQSTKPMIFFLWKHPIMLLAYLNHSNKPYLLQKHLKSESDRLLIYIKNVSCVLSRMPLAKI